MRLIAIIFMLSFCNVSIAASTWQLNNKFSSLSAFEHNPGSSGSLFIGDDMNVAKNVTTCFRSGFCGNDVRYNYSITSISGNSISLKDNDRGDSDNVTVILSDVNHLILLYTSMFSDFITLEDWGFDSVNTNLAPNYYLSRLFVVSSGFVMEGDGSTGTLSINPDGGSVHRNIMVCSFFDGCGMPKNQTLEISIVPGRKLFLKDQSSGLASENIIIVAEYENIILFEKSSSGGGVVTIWKPSAQ